MSNRTYGATRHPVSAQHSSPPIPFLDQLIDAIDPLPDDVFDVNDLHDIYAVMKGSLGPYTNLLHRKAIMCEVLRVQAAFESDWDWNEGVDINNLHSLTHIDGEETGAFQVSFDSTALGHTALCRRPSNRDGPEVHPRDEKRPPPSRGILRALVAHQHGLVRHDQ